MFGNFAYSETYSYWRISWVLKTNDSIDKVKRRSRFVCLTWNFSGKQNKKEKKMTPTIGWQKVYSRNFSILATSLRQSVCPLGNGLNKLRRYTHVAPSVTPWKALKLFYQEQMNPDSNLGAWPDDWHTPCNGWKVELIRRISSWVEKSLTVFLHLGLFFFFILLLNVLKHRQSKRYPDHLRGLISRTFSIDYTL